MLHPRPRTLLLRPARHSMNPLSLFFHSRVSADIPLQALDKTDASVTNFHTGLRRIQNNIGKAGAVRDSFLL